MSESSMIIDFKSSKESESTDLKESIKSIIELQKKDEQETEDQLQITEIYSDHSMKSPHILEISENEEPDKILNRVSEDLSKVSDDLEVSSKQEQNVIDENSVESDKSIHSVKSFIQSARTENFNESVHDKDDDKDDDKDNEKDDDKNDDKDDSRLNKDENLPVSSKQSDHTTFVQTSSPLSNPKNIRPLFGNRCTCDSPEKVPCAICYMKCQPCHCHPNARYQNDHEDSIYIFINFLVMIYSIMLFVVMWSFNFWICIGYALYRGIELFCQKDFQTKIIIIVLLTSLFMTIMIHAKLLGYKNSSISIKSELKSESINQNPLIHSVDHHKTFGTPKTSMLSRYWFGGNSVQRLKIEIREDNICLLTPREQTFTLTLLNDKMERVYNASTKIVIPQCGSKPILVVTPNPFELSRY